MNEEKFDIIAQNLTPRRPIRSAEYLRGRLPVLEDLERDLRHFHSVAFIYGHRGVGKTSLARTAAQNVHGSGNEHIYIACAPGARMLQIFREIGEEMLKRLFQSNKISDIKKKVDVEISLTPAIRTSFEKDAPQLQSFSDANAAIRVLKELDDLFPESESTVVVLDELEVLDDNDRADLAYLVKQIGDQEFRVKFILVGIAENVHELIGAHGSVPRYLKEVSLQPLTPQDLMDIVSTAANALRIDVPRDILYRIAIIGNGFPHFAHLMGMSLLTEAVLAGANHTTDAVYKRGVNRAVSESYQELRIPYETATQRGEDYFKHLIWALAHSDTVDMRTDNWTATYKELARANNWAIASDEKIRNAISNLGKENYGALVINTPARYGSADKRYRYKRFKETLMRGHVRLQAEDEGVSIGRRVGI